MHTNYQEILSGPAPEAPCLVSDATPWYRTTFVRTACLIAVAAYCILKPEHDFMMGRDTVWSRLTKPLQVYLTEEDWRGRYDAAWEEMLAENRATIETARERKPDLVRILEMF